MKTNNQSPRYNTVDDLIKNRNKSQYHSGLIARLILLGRHYTAYKTYEIKALTQLGEKPIVGWLSGKEYKMHLAQRERIEQFLEQEKLQKENQEKSL